MQNPSPYSTPPPNSTTATISLIAGILGLSILPGLASIVALVTGYHALKEIRESGGRLGGEGQARIGIVLGWIAIGVGLLAACCFAIFFILPFLGIAVQEFSHLPGLLPVFF